MHSLPLGSAEGQSACAEQMSVGWQRVLLATFAGEKGISRWTGTLVCGRLASASGASASGASATGAQGVGNPRRQ